MNRKPLINPDLSPEDKMKKLSKIIERLGRRSVKTAKAIITPYPISGCSIGDEVSGDILKYMFAGKGAITNAVVWTAPKLKSGARVTFTLAGGIVESAQTFSIIRRESAFEFDLTVSAGSRLTASIVTNDPEEKITECWIALQWIPDVKNSKVKQFLISELERESSDLLQD